MVLIYVKSDLKMKCREEGIGKLFIVNVKTDYRFMYKLEYFENFFRIVIRDIFLQQCCGLNYRPDDKLFAILPFSM